MIPGCLVRTRVLGAEVIPLRKQDDRAKVRVADQLGEQFGALRHAAGEGPSAAPRAGTGTGSRGPPAPADPASRRGQPRPDGDLLRGAGRRVVLGDRAEQLCRGGAREFADEPRLPALREHALPHRADAQGREGSQGRAGLASRSRSAADWSASNGSVVPPPRSIEKISLATPWTMVTAPSASNASKMCSTSLSTRPRRPPSG